MVFGKHINRYYFKYGLWLLLGILSLVVVDYAQLKVPEFYRMVINGMNNGEVLVNGQSLAFDMDFLLDKICLPMIFVILCMVTCRFLWRVCFFGSSVKMEADLRDRMFDHCKDLSNQYYQVNKVGDLMSLFTNDLDTVQDSFGNGILTAVDALVLGGLALSKMLKMNLKLTLFSMLPMLFLFLAGNVLGKYMQSKWEERQEKFSLLSDFTQETFSGIAVVKAFVKECKELLAFRKLNKQNEDVNVEYTRLSTLLNIFITLFVESVIAVILGYGGYLVYVNKFSAGEMVEFIGYYTAIIWPIEAIAILIEMTAKAQASLKRIGALLDAPIDVKDASDVEEVKEIKGEIEFKNLSFTYPGSTLEVLHDLSFKINAGENVGLIGKTGAGKTAIVDLISRIYNVNDGEIFIDGVDINRIPIKNLRDNLAYVPQDNFLFSDTIENNIAFAFEGDVPIEKVKQVAKTVDVASNIEEFTNGYKTVLGERGVTVSGGQKQRISIARAMMKDAKILILDDSVSAVDTKTERKILSNLKKERAGKTTILIAHRITTVKNMDKIIFIDEGNLVDVGTHKELLKRSKAYAEMVELQKLEDKKKEEE